MKLIKLMVILAIFTFALTACNSDSGSSSSSDPVVTAPTDPDPDPTPEPPTPRITLSAVSGNTTETGGQATFTVKLATAPSTNVTIPISVSDGREGAVSPASLTFTSANYATEQTVTLTGVYDSYDDEDQGYVVLVGPSVSSDADYNGLSKAVEMINLGNGSNSVLVINMLSGATTEGETAIFTVKLLSAPTAEVTIPLSSLDLTEATVDPASLTFTTNNWETNQTMTITGLSDGIADGSQTYQIQLGQVTSADANYSGKTILLGLNSTDDGAISPLVVGTISGNTSEEGEQATFDVNLAAKPNADVTISFVSSNEAEGTVSPASLVFTPDNYSTPQLVTITGQDDILYDGTIGYDIVISTAGGGYTGLADTLVSLFNWDDEEYQLPDTGQTTSYTATFGEDHDYLINDLSYDATAADGTVTDNNTGLQWQQCYYGISSGDGDCNGNGGTDNLYNWDQAITYCTNLNLGGHTDWRLPNRRELVSLVDYGPSSGLNINSIFFADGETFYWSSTVYASATIDAWRVGFYSGMVSNATKSNDGDVRCVRGQELLGNFADQGNGTVLDVNANLIWQQAEGGTMNWEAALAYCEGLDLPTGTTDWRLPNIKELESIVDATKATDPIINTTLFPGVSTSRIYWSSTTNASVTANAWTVPFELGRVFTYAKSGTGNYVRCVRAGQ